MYEDGAHHHSLLSQPGAVDGNCQTEISDTGCSVGGQPDVPRLQVPVHDALGVGELQAPAYLGCQVDGLIKGQAVVLGLLQ